MPVPFRCSLHVHTCLSPCGDLDMHPRAIVREALSLGLDVIAITDHNSSENVPYVIAAAEGTPLTVIPGMEVTTREEAHVLALFQDMSSLSLFQEYVYARLEGLNDENAFGVQAVVNENEEVEGFNERLLIGATGISLEDLVDHIHGYQGLAVAAHIDRPSFSVISQLGFVPDNIAFDALEISARLGIRKGREKFPELREYTFITSSDAHYLKDLRQASTVMYLESPTLNEIRMALRQDQGRFVSEEA